MGASLKAVAASNDVDEVSPEAAAAATRGASITVSWARTRVADREMVSFDPTLASPRFAAGMCPWQPDHFLLSFHLLLYRQLSVSSGA